MRLACFAAAAALISGPAIAQHAGHSMSAKDHAAKPASPASDTVQGTGVVKGVNAKGGTLTLQHGPIASLKWPAMTMTFKASADVLKSAKTGQKVTFTLKPKSNEIVALQSN
ncbi:MAG: copper-binding protein [Alphaproteobacteria bacterium]|jgi:Cu(I)/Ag(I) efflux system protein CusF